MATKDSAQKAFEAYSDFIGLCSLLFGNKPIDSVTQLPSQSPYCTAAKDIVKDFGMDWSALTVEDNNEIMLAMLDDYYKKIQTDKSLGVKLDIKIFKKSAKDKAE